MLVSPWVEALLGWESCGRIRTCLAVPPPLSLYWRGRSRGWAACALALGDDNNMHACKSWVSVEVPPEAVRVVCMHASARRIFMNDEAWWCVSHVNADRAWPVP